jgi:predicted DNA-binding mobile mystery protein A
LARLEMGLKRDWPGKRLEMREQDRYKLRRRLDEELRPFREAAKVRNPTNGLLRVVRRALGIPMAEIAREMDVVESVVYAFENSEVKGAVKMASLARAAEALGCQLVYGIVPRYGQTFEEMAEERDWREVLGRRERKDRDQGSGVRDQERASGSQVSGFSSGPSALGAADLVQFEETEDALAAGAGVGQEDGDAAGAGAGLGDLVRMGIAVG